LVLRRAAAAGNRVAARDLFVNEGDGVLGQSLDDV
jgi:hypothetical protein